MRFTYFKNTSAEFLSPVVYVVLLSFTVRLNPHMSWRASASLTLHFRIPSMHRGWRPPRVSWAGRDREDQTRQPP